MNIRTIKRLAARRIHRAIKRDPWPFKPDPFAHAWDAYVCEHVDDEAFFARYDF